ncbi:MAG: diacylglycerol kinase family lipid kinase [Saprospiraceae bacterium]
MISGKKIRCIINPFSGSGQRNEVADTLQRWSKEQQVDLDIVFTDGKDHATYLTDDAVNQAYFAVIAVGGDGTIHEVSKALVNKETAFAVIPQGSGNGFCYHIGINRNIDKALQYINQGQITMIDSGIINGTTHFINLAGIGIDGKVAYLTKKNTRRGFFPYFMNAIAESTHFKFQKLKINFDDEEFNDEFALVEIANGSIYGYGFNIAPRASISDGVLDVLLIKKTMVLKYLSLIPKMLTNNIDTSPHVIYRRSKKVRISTDEEYFFHLDGEGFIGNTDLTFEILPKSIKILAPNSIHL